MSYRFFCPAISSDPVVLEDGEAHHAIHVLRLAAGDAVEVFDGQGRSRSGVISKVRRNAVEVDAEAIVASERPRQGQLTVAAAIPKGDRLKSMVEKLAELGVDRFVPLKTARSVADPRQSKLERLESTVVSAAKQCGLNWLMTIEPTQDLTAVLQQAKAAGSDIRIAHPGTRSMDQASEPSAEAGTLLLIGPEGGFTDQEIQLAADSGALPISWRGSILRIETAAVVFSALLIDQLERNW